MRDFNPKEYKVMAMRDCPVPAEMAICEEPDQIAAYWRMHIEKHPYFDPECECLAVVLLNARKRVKGHQLLTVGTVDSVHVDNRTLFRSAVVMVACGIILVHNHPSGDPSPSQSDIAVTKQVVKAGALLGIDVIDHVIIGRGDRGHCSLRSLGYISA